jgi:hypothetical protein
LARPRLEFGISSGVNIAPQLFYSFSTAFPQLFYSFSTAFPQLFYSFSTPEMPLDAGARTVAG